MLPFLAPTGALEERICVCVVFIDLWVLIVLERALEGSRAFKGELKRELKGDTSSPKVLQSSGLACLIEF